MKIADIELGDRPLFLAPMEDVTDPSFRYMCKQFGADVVYTEFISSDGLIRDAGKSLAKLRIAESERPVGIQLYGHLVEPMVEAARIAEAADPDIIDINVGCPVKKIAGRGAGSGMMRDVPLMVEMTRRIVEAEQRGKRRAGYGEQLMERLSADLTAQFGRGFGVNNLESMRRFFVAYPLEAISETLSRKSGERLPIENSETVSRKFGLSELAQVFTLPWSAYVRLLSVKDDHACQVYETEVLAKA